VTSRDILVTILPGDSSAGTLQFQVALSDQSAGVVLGKSVGTCTILHSEPFFIPLVRK